MLTCKETGQELVGIDGCYAAARDNDGGRCTPLSEEAVKAIPAKDRLKRRQSYKDGGGVNIFQAFIAGENGSSHLEFEPEKNFLFSIGPKTLEGMKLSEDFPLPPKRS